MRSMSCTGMCSVTETMRGTWAEIASSMAFAARGGWDEDDGCVGVEVVFGLFLLFLNLVVILRRLTSRTVL